LAPRCSWKAFRRGVLAPPRQSDRLQTSRTIPRSRPAAPWWPLHNGRKPRLLPIALPTKPFDWRDDE